MDAAEWGGELWWPSVLGMGLGECPEGKEGHGKYGRPYHSLWYRASLQLCN